MDIATKWKPATNQQFISGW